MIDRPDPSTMLHGARRGAALLMAIFAMLVVGTATLAFTASRRTSILVVDNVSNSLRVRQLATSGLELTKAILRNEDLAWRTEHQSGKLLDRYPLDGGEVTVTLVDIRKREAGASAAASVPDDSSTEIEINVLAVHGNARWSALAHMSIPQVTKGQYAMYGNRLLYVNGTDNEIGRWRRAPKSNEKRRVNIGTMASKTVVTGAPESWHGVWLDSDVVLESEALPVDPNDPRSLKSTWVYYPYTGGTETTRLGAQGQGSAFSVGGPGASKVATNRMNSDESIRMKPAPEPTPTVPSPPGLTGGDTISSGSRTLYPFRVGNAKGKGNATLTTNDCTLLFTAGTYEIYGSWRASKAKIRIQGSVRIVVSPSGNTEDRAIGNGNDPKFTGIDWSDTTVELTEGADLEINNGYRLNMERCWIGGYYQCVDETDVSKSQGDPHMKAWMGQSFASTACDPTAPDEPHYFQPWNIRIYPIGSQQSPNCRWTVTDTSLIGSLFLPTSSILFGGKSQLYGRVAADSVSLEGTSRLRYDHALDDLSGLTEGRAPNRGGDPESIFPIRLLRWGPDKGNGP